MSTVEPAIARAAGDHDRTGFDALAVEEVENEGVAVAAFLRARAKAAHLIRDRHFGPEFLRLIVGARHQRDAGDAGRKAEIVFDPGRGAGLAAEGAAIEHEDGKPFRRGIDRRRETRRTGADDGDVVEAVRIDRPHQSDAARQFVFAGIAQQLSARTQHDRQLPGIDMEALDQRLRFGVGVGIEQLMRMTVAAEKALQPQHVGILGAADNDRTSGAESRAGRRGAG